MRGRQSDVRAVLASLLVLFLSICSAAVVSDMSAMARLILLRRVSRSSLCVAATSDRDLSFTQARLFHVVLEAYCCYPSLISQPSVSALQSVIA